MSEEKAPLLERSVADYIPAPFRRHQDGDRSRRTLYTAVILIATVIVLRLGLVLSWLSLGSPASVHEQSTGDEYLTAARRVLSKHPLIDGHDDLLISLRAYYGNHIYNSTSFRQKFENGGLEGHLDIPRIESGQLGGSFWSAFVPCPRNGTDFSPAAYAPYVRATLEQLDLYNRLGELYPKYFSATANSTIAASHFASGRLISPLAIEGLHQIGNSAATLRLYHALGVRYATLTWNCHNIYADAALVSNSAGETVVSTPLHHGVSPAGRALIHEMNRLGMLVDLSHVSANTMRDVLSGTSSPSSHAAWSGSLAPPIFSHSSVHGICPHPRNVPDDVLHLLKKRRGVVMINFAPDFISCVAGDNVSGLPDFVEETNTLEQVVRHIMYVGELIGYDYVGLGTDFDGIPNTPRGLEGVDKFPDLVAELLRRGVSEEDAGKVVGRNLLRVWGEADEVSARLKREGQLPLEDELKFSGGFTEWAGLSDYEF
ncbi:Dipeptidase-like protein [Elsinoe fawcettii]|nr:Dipeptidase-like protein [Elsinoe fawcettii]